ncbi:MAG TPA: redoxin domain-containing protein [Gemmatimonadaceae bacterium]|nr:redoxin domain-containing protein [Gemmatimonadaceae bacterium]
MNWKRALIGAVIAVPLIVLLIMEIGKDPRAITSPLPGRPAPAFTLAVFSYPTDSVLPKGKEFLTDTVRLDSLKGKVVVLNFWASWCLACRDEHASLSAAALMLRGEPVRFYGVLYQDVPENGRDWIKMMGGQTYEGLYDPGSRTAIDYGLYGVPETFFIGKDGKVAYKHVGAVTTKLVMDTVKALLARPVNQ